MKIKLSYFVIAALVVAAAIFVFSRLQEKKNFTFVPVKKGKIVESVYGIGVLTAQRSLSIKPAVAATIRKIWVLEGDSVKKDARLVDLDTAVFRAPFDGTVVSAPFKVGETVFSQTSVLTLVDLSDTYLLVSLEQQGALKVKPGQPTKISFDGLREQTFEGRVESVYSNANEFFARISIQNLPKSILPGMSADIAIIIREKSDVLLVPAAALEGMNLVLRRNGKVFRSPVEVGLNDGATVEISKGDVTTNDEAVVEKRETR